MDDFPDDDDLKFWHEYLNDAASSIVSKERQDQCDYAEIDLHGKTLDEAFNLVTRFIDFAYQKEILSIKIITGLGSNKNGEYGKLYQEVPKWMSHLLVREKVKSYERDQGALIIKIIKKF